MLRRVVSGIALGLALTAASLAWFGFVALHTVLDPGRSDAVAKDVYDDPDVRAQLAANIAAAVQRSLPPNVQVPPAQVEAAASAALDDPRVAAVVTDGFVRTHHALLGDGDPPRMLDAGAFGAAARDALVAARPDLAGVVPAAPRLEVALPTQHVPDLGGVRSTLRTLTPLAALVAVAGVAFAALVTDDRRRVLRRAGVWGVGAGVTWLAVGLGVPWLVRTLLPDQAAVIAAMVGAFCGAMIVPASIVAGAGALAWLAGRFWPAGVGTRTHTRFAPRPAPGADPYAAPERAVPERAAPAPYRPERTAVLPRPRMPSAPPVAPATDATPRWVEGVGYVDDDPTTTTY